ncbi:MAG: hypothetical protein RIT04_531 [Candidatus Parcubacteria bacterium]|jgi:LemA protein
MKTSTKIWIVVAGIVFLAVVYVFGTYNHLVTANEATTAKWKDVETLYQRRFDLIPNLVESVKGVMKQETTIFTEIADARSRYAGAQAGTSVGAKVQATQALDSALSRLLVITENYPQLKSAEAVQTFMAQLEGTENRISVERARFNEAVRVYNLIVKRAPSSIVASWFGFDAREYFEADPSSAVAPKVSL